MADEDSGDVGGTNSGGVGVRSSDVGFKHASDADEDGGEAGGHDSSVAEEGVADASGADARGADAVGDDPTSKSFSLVRANGPDTPDVVLLSP